MRFLWPRKVAYLFALCCLLPIISHAQSPRIAIVIDDLGYQMESGEILAHLPYPLTLAVIPNSTYAHQVAALISQLKQELILHVPMETLHQGKWEEGLHTRMDYVMLRSEAKAMFEAFPNIVGINNHGGSKFTADAQKMPWLMEILAQKRLYFLDSRTTAVSEGVHSAQEYGVPYSERDVFLDNEKDPKAIEAAFNKTRKIALKHGSAIAIGHPYPETMQVLKAQLPKLIEEGFELVFCSALLTSPNHIKPKSRLGGEFTRQITN